MYSHRPNYNSPAYKAFRYATYLRDGYQCVMCGRKGLELNAHHIQRVADAPHLEFVVNNAVTLCVNCHETVTGREREFVEQFKRIVAQKNLLKEAKKGGRPKKYNGGNKNNGGGKGKWKPRNPRLRF